MYVLLSHRFLSARLAKDRKARKQYPERALLQLRISLRGLWMQVVDPSDFFRRLDVRNFKIDHDRFLPASHEHAFERLIDAGVDFLVWNKRRDVDEITGPGFSRELELITPTHASLALDDVDHALKLAVMMSSRFCVGMYAHSSGPQLRSAGSSVSDCSGSIHSRSLRRIGVEFVRADDTNSVMFPIGHR